MNHYALMPVSRDFSLEVKTYLKYLRFSMAIAFNLTGKTIIKCKPFLTRHQRSIRVFPDLYCSMANTVRVGAVQMTSTDDLDANYRTCAHLIKEAAVGGVKLLCFPENFSFVSVKDGDSLKVAEPIDGPILQKFCSLARESSIWLSLGGFQEKGPDDAHLLNTHVLVDDSGNIRSTYRKIHLFDVDVPGNMVYKESNFTTAGNAVVVEDSPAGRLGLSVCYDLRFPELYQLLRFEHNAQVLLVPSAFTKVTGEAHWEILLRSRAIETQCFVGILKTIFFNYGYCCNSNWKTQ